ncbi:MAG: tryptophan--tRNA ligase [Clostridia bacterium]|nr:tryptophan--tRNA ligase [Clostridia bacterium]
MDKKRIFSGIQPSGALTIGNYLGAIKNWAKLIDEYDCIFSVVDLHAITVRQDPKELHERCLALIAQYIASGIDPEKCTIFIQSHVPSHAELGWILDCYTYMGELERMTQFKDKSSRHADNINAGLFTYPVLMAADILLYQTDLVPVGHDQKQHLELARDIADRFNKIYGDAFKVPEGYIAKMGARIMDLQNPEKKMSKSEPQGSIALLEDPASIIKKIKRAQTDSLGVISCGEGRHGMNNLISMYGAVTGKTEEQITAEFDGKGYGDFKKAIAEAVVAELEPIQNKYRGLMENKDYLKEVYQKGAIRAREIADSTMRDVFRRVGFVER